MQQIETNPVHVLMPKAHLGAIVASYLYQTKILEEDQTISSMNIPVDVDDDGNITITVGILKESIN